MDKQLKAVITTVIGALIIGFIGYTTTGVSDNSRDIALNKKDIAGVTQRLDKIDKGLSKIVEILLERKSK